MRPRIPLLLTTAALALSGCAGTAATSDASPASAAPSSAAEAVTDAGTPDGQRVEVTVAGGQVSGDTGRIPVAVGEQVTLVVTSDVADSVHVHGYDLTMSVSPGRPAQTVFGATVPGVFEVELHEAGTVLLTLQVG